MATRPPSTGNPRRTGTGGNQPQGQNTPPRFQLSGRAWLILIAVILFFNIIFYYNAAQETMTGPSAQIPLSYSSFIHQVNASNIKKASVSGDEVTGDFKSPVKFHGQTYNRFKVTVISNLDNQVVPTLQRHGADVTLSSASVPIWLTVLGLLLNALPFILLIGLFYLGSRTAQAQQQGVFGFGRSRAKLYTEERPTTTFADVAGVTGAKGELQEIVDFLKNPDRYRRLGARIPKGVLLVGPPGTGKTLLARAVAGEAQVPFLAISATEFVELFVGVGASRVRDLFEEAKKLSPSIVFVDEIDAIGGTRSSRSGFGGGNDEREQTLNQLLVSMDGFEPNEAVIVLSATNRSDILDPALLRPGRFDREIEVDPPDRAGREAILRIHTRQIPLAPEVDLGAVARATPGMSGADLANLANEAALGAARSGRSQVMQSDFDQALDRVTLGVAGSPLMNADERRAVAIHEGGHALVAYNLPDVDPVNRITITPRGRSLGVTQFVPADDRRNYRRKYLLNRMAVGLGGRAAEELALDDITSGAQNDLQQVTNIARTMVTELGMADDVGLTYFGNGGGAGQPAYNPFAPKGYSDEWAARIDEAVARLVNEAHDLALRTLSENRAALDAVAEALVHDESLERDQFIAIVSAQRGEAASTAPDGRTAASDGVAAPAE
jgi:cell division protease FtsH